VLALDDKPWRHHLARRGRRNPRGAAHRLGADDRPPPHPTLRRHTDVAPSRRAHVRLELPRRVQSDGVYHAPATCASRSSAAARGELAVVVRCSATVAEAPVERGSSGGAAAGGDRGGGPATLPLRYKFDRLLRSARAKHRKVRGLPAQPAQGQQGAHGRPPPYLPGPPRT